MVASLASTTSNRPAKQIVFGVMAATAAGVVLFLAGVQYGRATAARQAQAGDRQGAGPAASDVRRHEEPRPPILNVASGEPSAAAGAASDLTYFPRLHGDGVVNEEFVEAVETTAAAAPPETATAPTETATAADASASAAAEPEPSAAAAAAAPLVAPPSSGSAFTVQVTALQAAEAAEQVVGRLIAKGFPAYVRPPAPGDAIAVYRVRVGRYTDYSQADRIRLRLEQEEQFKPWITR